MEHREDYNLEATNTIHTADGHRVRGYLGIESLLPDLV